jgi:hypothetical protein
MISDVLFEAIADIRQYQKTSPDAYDEISEQIDAVVQTMHSLLEYLDAPPVMDTEFAKWEPVVSVYMRLLENPNTPPKSREVIKKHIFRLARIVDGGVDG